MSEDQLGEVNYSKFSIWFGLIWMLFASFLLGFFETSFFKENITSKSLPTLISNSIIGFGFLIWLLEDAKKNSFHISIITKLFAVFLPQITVFVYSFRCKGFTGGVIKSLKATVFMVLCFAAVILAYEMFGYD